MPLIKCPIVYLYVWKVKQRMKHKLGTLMKREEELRGVEFR